MKPFLRTAYNYDMNKAGDESGLKCEEPTLTKQSFKDECDINTIVKRFNLTGALPDNVRMPTYQDFDGVFDFHTAMNAIATANEAFDKMPAEVRSRFHNSPAEFLDFCNDASNRDEAIKLGLVPKPLLEPQAQFQDDRTPSPSPMAPKPPKTATKPPKHSPHPDDEGRND